jgi:hypothetical protein
MKTKLFVYIVACALIGTAVGCALLPPEDGNPSTTQPSTQPADDGGVVFDINSPALDGAAAMVPYGAVVLLLARLFFLERQKRDAKTRAKERTNPTVE